MRHQHALTAAQGGGRPLLHSLPATEERGEKVEEKVEEERMKIAWRYQGQASTKGESLTTTKGHTFNLLKTVGKEEVEAAGAVCWHLEELEGTREGWEGSTYCALLGRIRARLEEGGHMVEQGGAPPRGVARIGLASLGALGWGRREDTPSHLPTFLLALRALLRSSLAVAVVTVPHHLHDLAPRLNLASDFVVELHSFGEDGEVVGAAYKEYHGLVKVHRLPALGSLAPPTALTAAAASELVFKSRRTQFVIERFSLPPDLGERVSRDTKAAATKADLEF